MATLRALQAKTSKFLQIVFLCVVTIVVSVYISLGLYVLVYWMNENSVSVVSNNCVTAKGNELCDVSVGTKRYPAEDRKYR